MGTFLKEEGPILTPFEQLELPIPPVFLSWIATDEKNLPLVTPNNVKVFSRERTGNTNLGTRIVNSIERALGYNRYLNPAPSGYSPEEVFSVLEAARENPDAKPFWWLGGASMQLFQEYCDEVKTELTEKARQCAIRSGPPSISILK
jgi:hypothetical protein